MYGITNTIPGPTMQDIANLTNSTFADVSHGMAIRSAGYAAGTLMLGYLFHHVNRRLGFILSLILCGLATILIPLSRTLTMYNISMTAYGFTSGGVDVGSNAWIMELWGKGSGPRLQMMHFLYAIGRTAGFLLVSVFSPKHPLVVDKNPYHVAAPFLIAGSALLVAAIILMLLHHVLPFKLEASEETNSHNSEHEIKTSDRPVYRKTIISVTCFLMLFYPGCEFNSFTFLSQFFVFSDLHFSESKAAFMQSAMSGAFAAIRGVCMCTSANVSSRTTIICSIACLITAYTMLLFYTSIPVAGIYVALILDGMGLGPMTPSVYAFMRERIVVDDRICGFLLFSRSLSQITVSILMGLLIESQHMSFLYWGMTCLAFVAISFATLIANDAWHKGSDYIRLPK